MDECKCLVCHLVEMMNQVMRKRTTFDMDVLGVVVLGCLIVVDEMYDYF